MEVDNDHFRKHLLPILKHISRATFIAFDLEMSGITTRPRYQPGDRFHDVGKPSLQEQYLETKEAAETFQVLQLGITCVEEDREREYYLARPFNFNVSPLIVDEKGLDFERRFTFSSSACTFLHDQGFDFGRVFSRGIPYLSVAEEIKVLERYEDKVERSSRIPDVAIPNGDVEAINFYENARRSIAEWIRSPEPKTDFCNVGNSEGSLNGFQRRLVYQLIRKEFPGYRTFGRNDGHFMQVVKSDASYELKEAKKKKEAFDSKLAKQKGLRWIFDALSGGSLEGIDPAWFCNPLSETYARDKLNFQLELREIFEALKSKKHIIIGHNVFTDLCFLYATFVGKLPNLVTHFQNSIHKLFPTIIDTKYLYTHASSSMKAKFNLKELLEPFKKVHLPLIVLHEQHANYNSSLAKSHEAGYDSWMTAELFVKLTAKIYAERKRSNSRSDDEVNRNDGHCSPDSDDYTGGALLNPPHTNGVNRDGLSDDLPPVWHARQLNRFAALSVDRNYADDNGENGSGSERAKKVKQWIPGFKSSFWVLYANRLRVAGVEGGVCDLMD